jgi:OmpA-OmpF porin, OOP family
MASKLAPDLLNQVSNLFTSDTVNQIASVFGETPAKTQSALGSLVPAILGSLSQKATTIEGANDVIDMIRRNNLTSVKVEDIYKTGGVTDLTNKGRLVSEWIFGNKLSAVTDSIATNSGISRSAVTSLASICAPIVLGLIGRRLGSGGMNASTLSSLLGNPSIFLQNLPAGLLSALGLAGTTATVRNLAEDPERRTVTAPAYPQPASSAWRWLLPLLLAVVGIGLIAYLFSRRPEPVNVTTVQPTVRPEAPAPAAPAPAVPASTNLGAFIETKLPDGVSLRIPSNGVESKLLSFIQDSSKAVDKTTWFSFDRIEFETDSAKLKASSQEQLSNIAAILKAYPQVDLKIGGYTDNTGDSAHNLKLSQDRAANTLNELVTLGTAQSRLEAEGYGQQFPIADNTTPEGRQRNRRIDIRVTKK